MTKSCFTIVDRDFGNDLYVAWIQDASELFYWPLLFREQMDGGGW